MASRSSSAASTHPSDNRTARLILNALPNIGPISCRRMLAHCHDSPAAIFLLSRQQLLAIKGIGPAIADTLLNWRSFFNPSAEEEKMAQRNLRFVTPEDGEAYPPLLRETYDPPLGLYVAGNFRWHDRTIAIVGSRRTTPYGRAMARSLAAGLAAAGWCVVSGLARGIDTAAHQGALDAGGATTAVLGCGPDIVYPPENLDLLRAITEQGAVFSEFPLGRSADKQTFPMRNRIVAGMSRATLVIESDLNGGSMITARMAADQNRLVCALPGRADHATSRGCHALIREGATLVTSVEEILEELGEAPAAQGELPLGPVGTRPELSAAEENLWQHFTDGSAHSPDTLADRTALPVANLMATLLALELKNLLIKNSSGRYEAAPRTVRQ